jgi:hypothetical protein
MTGITLPTLSEPPRRETLPAQARTTLRRARSVDSVFLSRLLNARFHGRVHSVFARVVNMVHDDSRLYTLAAGDLDDAPNTAVLEGVASFAAFDLAVGDPVRGDAQRLQVGDGLAVVLTAASAWTGALPRYPATPSALCANLCCLRAELPRLGAGGGTMTSPTGSGTFDHAVTTLLEQRVDRLSAALEQCDLADAVQHARAMLGLGPGLTPSGDDFLVGLFAVFNVAGSPCHGWLRGGREVLDGAEDATHAISLAALTEAAAGRVRASITALIAHLLHGLPGSLPVPLRRVLAIGSTSGADIVAGIRCGLELNIFHGRKSSCQSRW